MISEILREETEAMVQQVGKGDKCEVDGCWRYADSLVYSEEKGAVMKVCLFHDESDYIVSKRKPEYKHTCPNCGCTSGVN